MIDRAIKATGSDKKDIYKLFARSGSVASRNAAKSKVATYISQFIVASKKDPDEAAKFLLKLGRTAE